MDAYSRTAIYPIDLMPRSVQIVSRINPLTHQVNALRTLMLRSAGSLIGLVPDFAVLATAIKCLIAVAARLYLRTGI